MFRWVKVLGVLMWDFHSVKSVMVGGIFHFDVEVDFEFDADTIL